MSRWYYNIYLRLGLEDLNNKTMRRFNKRPNNRKFTVHHRFQQCDWWSNHPCNLVKMEQREHIALHMLFGEDWTLPIDKIRMIVELHKPVLCLQFVKQITEILDYRSKQGKQAYNPDALSRRCRLKNPKNDE